MHLQRDERARRLTGDRTALRLEQHELHWTVPTPHLRRRELEPDGEEEVHARLGEHDPTLLGADERREAQCCDQTSDP